LNNNRGNNRRRGRGNNNRQQGGGGGQQTNRIDSRARGNAPQLLEKYRKLAHDAHLNGDRVTEEYYLQFADHYFRVLADQRARQEEARQPRPERWQDGGENSQERFDSDAGSEYGGESEYQSNPYNYGERREREETPRYREETPRFEQSEEAAPAEQRSESPAEEGNAAEAASSVYEPPQNPFTRDNNRGQRGLKPRRPRRDGAAPQEAAGEDNSAQLDLAALPPSIAPREEAPAVATEDAPVEAAEAKPKRRAPRRKAADKDEPLKAAS